MLSIKYSMTYLTGYAPIKQKRVSQPRWFNDDLSHEIKKRDHLFKKAKRSQKTEDWKLYKSVKMNLLVRLKRTTLNLQ